MQIKRFSAILSNFLVLSLIAVVTVEMKKKRLEIDYYYDFELLGVISTAKGYKLAWEINRNLFIRLVKQPDLILTSKNKTTVSYSYFSYETNAAMIKLFRNKPNEIESGKFFLIPEYPHLDYVIMVRGEDQLVSSPLQELLRNIPSVELIAFIPLDALKSKDNFIF